MPSRVLSLLLLQWNRVSGRVLFQKPFAPLAWIASAVLLTACIGLGWVLDARMGLVTGVFTGAALLLGSILAIRKHREASLCWGNISIGGFLAFLCPLGGL